MAVAWEEARHKLRLVTPDSEPIDQGSPREAGFVILPAEFRTIDSRIEMGDGKTPLPKGVLVGVYMALASYAGDTDVVWPAVKRLAEDTGWSDDYIARALLGLEKLGFIGVERSTNRGMKRSNRYTLSHHKTPKDQIPSPAVTYPFTADPDTADSGSSTRSQRHEEEPRELEPFERYTPPSPPRPEPRPQKRATQIPENFAITDSLRRWGDSDGFTLEQMQHQVAQFIDHHTGAGTTKKDWEATFRTWMRNARQWNRLDSRNGSSSSGSSQLPGGIEVQPGERVEQIGPASWNLHGRDGRVRKVRPEYFGVVWDERQHINDGAKAFYAAVAVARERQEGT